MLPKLSYIAGLGLGMRLRPILLIGSGLAVALPAHAGQIKFAPETFEIIGGLSNSPPQNTRHFAFLGPIGRTVAYHGRETVDFETALAPGSIIVRTEDRKLYYVLGGGKAIQYGVGVGREGFT